MEKEKGQFWVFLLSPQKKYLPLAKAIENNSE